MMMRGPTGMMLWDRRRRVLSRACRVVLLPALVVGVSLAGCATGSEKARDEGVPGDVKVCDLMTAGDMNSALDRRIKYFAFSKYSYDENKPVLTCMVLFTDHEEVGDGLDVEYEYNGQTGYFGLPDISASYDYIKAEVPHEVVSVEGVEGEGFTAYWKGNSYFVWQYPSGHLLAMSSSWRDAQGNSVDGTDKMLALGRSIAPIAPDVASGPSQKRTVYPSPPDSQ